MHICVYIYICEICPQLPGDLGFYPKFALFFYNIASVYECMYMYICTRSTPTSWQKMVREPVYNNYNNAFIHIYTHIYPHSYVCMYVCLCVCM